MRLVVGSSMFISTGTRLRPIYVTNPRVLDSMTSSPNQIVVTAKSPGSSSLILWDEDGHTRSYRTATDYGSHRLARCNKSCPPHPKYSGQRQTRSGLAVRRPRIFRRHAFWTSTRQTCLRRCSASALFRLWASCSSRRWWSHSSTTMTSTSTQALVPMPRSHSSQIAGCCSGHSIAGQGQIDVEWHQRSYSSCCAIPREWCGPSQYAV
jgi:hypothetical protein